MESSEVVAKIEDQPIVIDQNQDYHSRDEPPGTTAVVINSGDPIEGYAPNPRTFVVQELHRSLKFKSLFD
ncbi:hypothetical protein TIFTF001_036655 [Ficus carica]|uniref:Uncharacterized protein n=1 Tax=Ficus carica TaxID=3494 RepID=A0AA88J7Z5_FICCA|nr:hypothetical protein TIFTF001_035055 [Ficus carica]GMN67576.1 hypothetical protein TIFTF001_036640 [Ficus carica]GMN67593.1 hypothetical protein TIFTF001_036655 [Ficus carica]